MSDMRAIPLPEEIDEHFVPVDEAEMMLALGSWRLFSGQLYKINRARRPRARATAFTA